MRDMQLKRQAGASIVHWLIALIPLMGFGALAIDLNNVYVSLAQLQAAADAGALEGARLLYVRNPVTNALEINTSASNAADAATKANLVQGDVLTEVTVSRGHWQFTTNTPNPADPPSDPFERGGLFTANPSTTVFSLTNADGTFKTWQEVNSAVGHINAVEVVAARNLTPIQAFFGQLLGINGYQAQATAVAYIGFAGSVDEQEFDIPIAMCQEVLTEGCDVARLVPEPEQSGGWTSLVPHTDGSCGGAVPDSTTRAMVADSKICGGPGVNAQSIPLGAEIPVVNGQQQNSFSDMFDCWWNDSSLDTDADEGPDQVAEWFMPVINGCSFGGQCAQVIGGIRVEVIWMFDPNPNSSGTNSLDNTAPKSMDGWTASKNPDGTYVDGATRWNEFVDHFDLQMTGPDGYDVPAYVANGGTNQKTVYFKPSCDPVELGGTGGPNYGVLSKVPVLVR